MSKSYVTVHVQNTSSNLQDEILSWLKQNLSISGENVVISYGDLTHGYLSSWSNVYMGDWLPEGPIVPFVANGQSGMTQINMMGLDVIAG